MEEEKIERKKRNRSLSTKDIYWWSTIATIATASSLAKEARGSSTVSANRESRMNKCNYSTSKSTNSICTKMRSICYRCRSWKKLL